MQLLPPLNRLVPLLPQPQPQLLEVKLLMIVASTIEFIYGVLYALRPVYVSWISNHFMKSIRKGCAKTLA